MSPLNDSIAGLHAVLAQGGLSRAPIIVMGMHRSGTTIITKLLENAGVFMGARLSGNRESRAIQDANRQIFDYFRAGWLDPEGVPRPEILLNGFDGLCSEIAWRLTDDISKYFFEAMPYKNVAWGFKDPRSSVTAGLFLRLFPTAKAIFIHRNVEDVALSVLNRELKKREKFPAAAAGIRFEDPVVLLTRAIKAWEVYNERSIAILPHFSSHVTISYEDMVVSPYVILRKGFAKVGVEISDAVISCAGVSSERVGRNSDFADLFKHYRQNISKSPVYEALGR